MAAETVTVCSKLPFDFIAEVEGVKVKFAGAAATDAFGERHLTSNFGLTHGVDATFYAKWKKEMGDFAPLKNGSIFAESTAEKAKGASKERKADIKSGFEQKTPEEMSVEAVVDKD